MERIKKYLYLLQKSFSSIKIYIKKNPQKVLKIFLPILFFIILIYGIFFKAPYNFPINSTIHIEEGSSLHEITKLLKDKNIIKSELLFKLIVKGTLNQRSLLAGDYYLEKRENLFSISNRIIKGEFDLTPVVIIVPEGSTIYQIANILDSKIATFDKEKFIELSKEKEGYLFPDTYYFLPNIKEEQIIKIMEDNFYKKIATIKTDIEKFDKSLEEVIIMASLVEEEARTTETRRIVAGILWDRLDLGIPLQVDAVFPYINGKNTFELTTDDLKIDSPYNTYLYKGLPKGPITNPGLDSIKSTITPLYTEYLFYLSDKDGNMHYSRTFEGHIVNKNKYLK